MRVQPRKMSEIMKEMSEINFRHPQKFLLQRQCTWCFLRQRSMERERWTHRCERGLPQRLGSDRNR